MPIWKGKKDAAAFWKKKSLSEMTPHEWEMLCDGCGRCCLHKLEDERTGEITPTYVSCRYLDIQRCRCTIYHDPYRLPRYCKKLSPENVRQFTWLPATCAYRRIAEGKPLEWWHPLVTGNPETVHEADISVRDKVVSESIVHPEDMEQFIVPVVGDE
jgi:uncharacterized cysteine cluster protein YcgN (CxxCxxCC family)